MHVIDAACNTVQDSFSPSGDLKVNLSWSSCLVIVKVQTDLQKLSTAWDPSTLINRTDQYVDMRVLTGVMMIGARPHSHTRMEI